ncbi:MAG: pyruvate dehydrogenase [Elusimicrobia bacterium]|nr:pyruvate dehydrogenase [Elusimicrobiota bacterium]
MYTDMAATRETPGLRDLYRQAFLIRGVELRLLELFGQGKVVGTIHTCVGQELSGPAVTRSLREGDLVFSNHRGHGHYIARTGDVEGLVAEVMGKRSGACGGRGGSQHLHKDGFFSNGVQGGIVPVAAGLALGLKLKGSNDICVVFIGDGTLGEGVVYEALNIASKWALPLLIVLEDNLYAQSTPRSQTLAGDIGKRAEAFGIPAAACDTWRPEELVAAAGRAVEGVRAEGRPRLLVIGTYRLKAHSKGDDDRDPAEVRAYAEKDPLSVFAKNHPDEARGFERAAAAAVAEAVAKAEKAGDPVPPGPARDARPLGPRSQAAPRPADADPEGGRDARPPASTAPRRWTRTDLSCDRPVVALIREALARNMERDERIVVLGEDVADPYGGAFKATQGLSTRFPSRVFNAPISEAAIVGVANGLALHGRVPVAEIMFGDFLTLCADQIINHASKFRYMYNDAVRVPLVLRTPMGGRRGYGPTHSQALEKHFLGVPDTMMLALHGRYDPGKVYDALLAGADRPTLVIEDKLLYGQRLSREAPAGFVWEHTDEPFPTSRLRPSARADLTILAYGGMLPHAEAAVSALFEEHDLVAELVCPILLYPWDHAPLLESVQATGRLLVAEEGVGFAAFGAEAASALVERAPGVLRQLKRVASHPHPVPSAASLERAALPGAAAIVAAVLEMNIHGE